MRPIEAIFAPDELLPAKIEIAEVRCAARVDDAARLDLVAAEQRHEVVADLHHFHAGDPHRRRQPLAHRHVQPVRTDRVVPAAQLAAMVGEGDDVPVPMVRHQRLHQPAVGVGDIAVEERPQVVAAKRVARLDQHDRNVRPLFRHGQRQQAAREPAAGDDQPVMFGQRHQSNALPQGRACANAASCARCPCSDLVRIALWTMAPPIRYALQRLLFPIGDRP
jgi:hypothetical protein